MGPETTWKRSKQKTWPSSNDTHDYQSSNRFGCSNNLDKDTESRER